MLESSTVKLAKANRFDPNALTSNRRGQLTNNQARRFALRLASMALSIIVSIVFGIAWIVLAAAIVPKEAFLDNWVSPLIAILSVLVGLILISDGIKHVLQDTIPLLRDVLGGQVMIEEGRVSRDYDDTS